MNTNTMELLLSDMLGCGYADIDMLDILYSPLGDEITDQYLDRTDLLSHGDLNSILNEFYYTCNSVMADRVNELLEEYTDSLDEKGNPTELTERTEIVTDTELDNFFYPNEEFTPLTEKQITTITEEIEKLNNSYPFCNYLDSHFGSDLDQTLDEDMGIYGNSIQLIKYWLSNISDIEEESEE